MQMTRAGFVAVLTSTALVALAGCGSAKDEAGGGSSGAGATSGDTASSGGGKEITIGYIDWDEDVAVTHLWKKVLEDKGYKVKMQHVSDAGPVYVGLDRGDVDLFMDGWLPVTHKAYWDKFGKNLTDIQPWYTNTKLTIAVPTYMKIDSIDQIKSMGGKVDNKIVGIEAGAGLTAAAKKMQKDYGLNDWKLQTSSTPAMLAALKKATDAKKPIVVTLWRPHWAYSQFPIKDLKDPKGSMGKTEKIHAVGTKSFAKDFPQVTSMLKNFTMDDKQLAALESATVQKNKSNPAKGVDEWLKANPDFVKSLG